MAGLAKVRNFYEERSPRSIVRHPGRAASGILVVTFQGLYDMTIISSSGGRFSNQLRCPTACCGVDISRIRASFLQETPH